MRKEHKVRGCCMMPSVVTCIDDCVMPIDFQQEPDPDLLSMDIYPFFWDETDADSEVFPPPGWPPGLFGDGTDGEGDGALPPGVYLPLPLVEAAAAIVTATTFRIIPGHPVMIFSIPQVVNLTYPVQTYEGIMMNNYPLNRTDFRLVRGVANEIAFFVRDLDRKPVSLTVGDVLTIVITDLDTNRLLMQRTLGIMDLANGIYKLNTLPAEMDTWPTGPVRWSVNYKRADGTTVMLWTDQSYGPYSAAYVTKSPYPGPAAPTVLLWSDFTLGTDGYYYSANLPAAAVEGYANGLHTFLFSMTGFGGSVRIDATTIGEPDSGDWFPVASKAYVGNQNRSIINVQGNYLWLRLAVGQTGGSLDNVQYKS